MNNQLIAKVIKYNSKSSTDFVYDNPLLDRNMARSLAKSFVRILSVSSQGASVCNNLRLCVLENIRKLCQSQPDAQHKQLDDNVAAILTQFYDEHMKDLKQNDAIERKLDAFLIRKMKDMSINSRFESQLNPEVIQALINLNCQGVYLEKLSADIIHWDQKSDKHFKLMKDLWTDDDSIEIFLGTQAMDNVSIKMKAELERVLLEISLFILRNPESNIQELISSNEEILNLIKKCSVSVDCFQMTTGILNFIFITCNFDLKIQEFIPAFVREIKALMQHHEFMMLYPQHVSPLVILLDTDLETLPDSYKESCTNSCLHFLKKLHDESEHDLILMLSHYPQWFDVYFTEDHPTAS